MKKDSKDELRTIHNEWSELQTSIDAIVRATGIDLAKKSDYALKKALQEQAPRAYWLISHFPFRWLSRIMRMEIINHQSPSSLNRNLEFKIYGKTIGRAQITTEIFIQ